MNTHAEVAVKEDSAHICQKTEREEIRRMNKEFFVRLRAVAMVSFYLWVGVVTAMTIMLMGMHILMP